MLLVSLVTCAGPDDANHPAEVAALGAEFPLVELGIQLSERRAGSSTYPSVGWIASLAAEAVKAGARAALHVNGSLCRELCGGKVPSSVGSLLGTGAFTRVQLNFSARGDDVGPSGLLAGIKALGSLGVRVVLQSNEANAALIEVLRDAEFDVLFDESGGLGARSNSWPGAIPGRFNAWAGGISPETALDDIARAAELAAAGGMATFGIDAQGRLRTPPGMAGIFNLNLARDLARAADTWNETTKSRQTLFRGSTRTS
jgi:hypothetical protein